MKRSSAVLAASCLLFSAGVCAQDSGFLEDYSKLTEGGNSGFTRTYIAPGAPDAMANITNLMVDQPEIFIDPASKYKGVKPSDAVAVAEELRAAFIQGIQKTVPVVEEAGEGTGLLSWAVTNIRVNKKKRGVLGYTPVGAVAYGVKSGLSDVVDKTRAFDVTFEVEGRDAATGQVLFAMVFDMGDTGEEVQWRDALTLSEGLGKRTACRLTNTKLAASERVDCMNIPIAID